MWSDQYNYYNIQYDEKFSQRLEKSTVVAALLETNWFKQINHQSFANADTFPWLEIVLVETYDGNFASSEDENQYVTLIAVVCLKGKNVDQMVYINAFKQIAKKLNWKVYLEENDFGIENIEV